MRGGDPDEDLVRRVARGDARAIETLVAAKLPRLLALARRMLGDPEEAEDVCQEVFLRIWRNAAAWRPGPAKFDTWVHRVTLNLCYDRLRRHRERPLVQAVDQIDPGPAPDAGLNGLDTARRVEQALQSIAPRQREAIILTYYQDMSNAEAALTMNIAVEALESLLSRGRRALRALLLEDDNDA